MAHQVAIVDPPPHVARELVDQVEDLRQHRLTARLLLCLAPVTPDECGELELVHRDLIVP